MKKFILSYLLFFHVATAFGDNQTATVSPVLPQTSIPFDVSITLSELTVPNGWHSGAVGVSEDQWLVVAGRTNGLHGFSDDPLVNNFPPRAQNTTLTVIDFKKQMVYQRSLLDPNSGLTQEQVDTLSVTSPQYYQKDHTLYITGGYGIDTATGTMGTKSTLTAINIPGLIKWVINPNKKGSASKHIRQTSHPILQVTGGYMGQAAPHLPTLLIFGQNFTGFYRDLSNGQYTQQVRVFKILDNGEDLNVIVGPNQPAQNPAYRRRDLNVVPVMSAGKKHPVEGYVALSGVFTLTGGMWTVPVNIDVYGNSFMADPTDPNTFKQAMNNYTSATVGLFSKSTGNMYIMILGGITYGFFDNGVFSTDNELPFTNEVTTIKIDKNNVFSQYIMDGEYPVILSTQSNPGNQLLFGAGAAFLSAKGLPYYRNGVIEFDRLDKKPILIGHILGGIQSTLPNTNTSSDSAASPYIFDVILTPRN